MEQESLILVIIANTELRTLVRKEKGNGHMTQKMERSRVGYGGEVRWLIGKGTEREWGDTIRGGGA